MSSSDVAVQQLIDYAKKNNSSGGVLTTSSGAPIADKTQSKTANVGGPQLMQDFVYMDEMAHFNRERIPERVVHAKGAGAFGYFEVTKDVTKYCKAAVFSEIGKKTPVAVRFSTVGGESGSADTVRDPRGFAVKMFTSEGNWDLVGNNTPIFFINDPIMFPSFIHTQKRNPETHLKDANMMWDFWSLRTESCHQVMFLFSDRGIPDGYRHMNGYGSHTFKLVNKEGNTVWCKFHFKTDQGSKNLPVDKAGILAGSDPDYSIRDLYNSIANGNPPSWTLQLQIMTNEDVSKCEFDPFDVTKVWPHKTYPLIEVGKMVLNRNPSNYFAEVEQMAFSPAHFVPGIEASPDKMLQGRLFAYSDAHRYRLGVNYHQIPVNKPHVPVRNYQKDGFQCLESSGKPVYYPNSFQGPTSDPKYEESKVEIPNGKRYIFPKNDDFTQAGQFYRVTLKAEEKQRLAENIAGSLKCAMPAIQTRALNNFARVDNDLAKKISTHMKKA